MRSTECTSYDKPTKIDLHLHTYYSADGSVAPETYVKLAREFGFAGIAITDHDRIEGATKAYECAKKFDDFIVIRGCEISTAKGHILALGITRKPPLPKYCSLDDAIEFIEAEAGIAIVVHPFRVNGTNRHEACRKVFAALEVKNGRCTFYQNAKALKLARKLGSPEVGGSDGHTIPELGRCFTIFDTPINTVDELLDKIKAGRTVAEGMSISMYQKLCNVGKNIYGWFARGMKRV
jgi:hypothetical protein